MFPFIGALLGGIGKAAAAIGAFGSTAGGAALLSGGAKIIGGAITARAQAKAAFKAGQLDLGRLRQEALENGFNPLTVLNATGGGGFQSGPGVPGFLSLAAGMIGNLPGDVFEAQRVAKNDGIANALLTAQTNSLNAMTRAVTSSSPATPTTGNTFVPYDQQGFIPAYTPQGKPIMLHAGVAKKLGIEPGGIYMAEDDEAVLGDMGSLPSQLGGAGDSFFESLKGWFGSPNASPFMKPGHDGLPGIPVAPSTQPAPPPLTIAPYNGGNPNRGRISPLMQ